MPLREQLQKKLTEVAASVEQFIRQSDAFSTSCQQTFRRLDARGKGSVGFDDTVTAAKYIFAELSIKLDEFGERPEPGAVTAGARMDAHACACAHACTSACNRHGRDPHRARCMPGCPLHPVIPSLNPIARHVQASPLTSRHLQRLRACCVRQATVRAAALMRRRSRCAGARLPGERAGGGGAAPGAGSHGVGAWVCRAPPCGPALSRAAALCKPQYAALAHAIQWSDPPPCPSQELYVAILKLAAMRAAKGFVTK